MLASSYITPKFYCVIHCCLLTMMACTAAGCTVIKYGSETLITEPARFAINIDRHRTEKENKQIAESAWWRCAANNPEPFSDHYRTGFISGFAEFLQYGGNVAPPLVPPREYWKRRFRSPAGRAAIQDWFAGHTAGFEYARDVVPREVTTVASSLFAPGLRIDLADPAPLDQSQPSTEPAGEFESIPGDPANRPQAPATKSTSSGPGEILPDPQQHPHSLNIQDAPPEHPKIPIVEESADIWVTPETDATQPIALAAEHQELQSSARRNRQTNHDQ